VSRHLIVNADDFGQTRGINAGIIEAYERGIVTSTSLMVRGAAVEEAAAYAVAHPDLSVGLHLDLGEWQYRNGEWRLVEEVVDTADPAAVAAELDRQVAAFVALAGRPPSHLDSHQHVHRDEPARAAVVDVATRLGVPVRHLTSGVSYRGQFYGQTGKGEPYPQAITAEALIALLRALPEGWTELGCHPGRATEGLAYGREREQELTALCAEAVAEALEEEGIRLRSFHHVASDGVSTDKHPPAEPAATKGVRG
jgi:chitin disaccharide deacetylase